MELFKIEQTELDGTEVNSVNSRDIYEYLEVEIGSADLRRLRKLSVWVKSLYGTIPDYIIWLFMDSIDLHKLMLLNIIDTKKLTHTKTYVIQNSITGLYKIGRTRQKNVNIRLAQISGNGGVNTLVMTINKNVENKLHKQYKSKRLSGEWFNLTTKDIKEIGAKYV